MDVQIFKLLMDGKEKDEIFEILKHKTNDPRRLAKEIAKYPGSFFLQKYNKQLVWFSNLIYFSYFLVSILFGMIPFLIGLFFYLNRRIGNINRLRVLFFINFPISVFLVGWFLANLRWDNLRDLLIDSEVHEYIIILYFLIQVFVGFYSLFLLIKVYQFRFFFRFKWDKSILSPEFKG